MKKINFFILAIMLLGLVGCSMGRSPLETKNKGIIVNPSALPREFMTVAKEYDKLYKISATKTEENSELLALNKKLCDVAAKYNIKVYSEKEFRDIIIENDQNNYSMRSVDSLKKWLNSIYYYKDLTMEVNWEPYSDAKKYDVWRKYGNEWAHWVELIPEAAGFVDHDLADVYYVRCTGNNDKTAAKELH